MIVTAANKPIITVKKPNPNRYNRAKNGDKTIVAAIVNVCVKTRNNRIRFSRDFRNSEYLTQKIFSNSKRYTV